MTPEWSESSGRSQMHRLCYCQCFHASYCRKACVENNFRCKTCLLAWTGQSCGKKTLISRNNLCMAMYIFVINLLNIVTVEYICVCFDGRQLVEEQHKVSTLLVDCLN